MGKYVMVGLASRRILLHPSTEHMVAQVFRLQQPHGGETSMRVSGISVCVCHHVCILVDYLHYFLRLQVSLPVLSETQL